MRITDKRNGEPVGRILAHPLQREFERSLTRVLGSQENWKVGDKISTIEFNNISNKEYVHNQLLARGFKVGKIVSLYVYAGQEGKKVQITKGDRNIKRPNAPVTILDPDKHYGRREIRKMLRDGEHFSTEGLSLKRRKVISNAIIDLGRREGMSIVSEILRKKNVLSGVIYWLYK